MLTREDVESFLHRMEQEFEDVEEGMWVVRTAREDAGLVVHYSPPVLLFRLKVLDLPDNPEHCAALYRRLLELNASDLVHGSYGLDEDTVILSATLELENLDFNEFQATVDSVQLAAASHIEALAAVRHC